MKKLNLTLAALVLSTGVLFAQLSPDPAKGEKGNQSNKTPKAEKKAPAKKADKKTDKKTATAPAAK